MGNGQWSKFDRGENLNGGLAHRRIAKRYLRTEGALQERMTYEFVGA